MHLLSTDGFKIARKYQLLFGCLTYNLYSNIVQLYIELTKCLKQFCTFRGGTECDHK